MKKREKKPSGREADKAGKRRGGLPVTPGYGCSKGVCAACGPSVRDRGRASARICPRRKRLPQLPICGGKGRFMALPASEKRRMTDFIEKRTRKHFPALRSEMFYGGFDHP